MIDNDCNGLIDCDDPACAICVGGTNAGQPCNTPQTSSACTTAGGMCECPPILKDPTTIKFGPPGAGLDQFKSHGRAILPAGLDVAGSEVGWLLTNANGAIYSAVIPAGTLTPSAHGSLFLYTNKDAKLHGGIYKAKIKITHLGTYYGYRVESYGDISRATDPVMSLQYYIGNQPTSAIHTETWKRTRSGWAAHGFS